MMNIREFFSKLYENSRNDEEFNKVMDMENKVYEWYCNEDSRWDEFVEQNHIDVDDVENMMDGSQEYSITLWCWDMCDE